MMKVWVHNFFVVFLIQDLSYLMNQKHVLMLTFNIEFIQDSTYLIFDYMVFIDRFLEKDNKVFQLQFEQNHKYVVIILQYQNLQFLLNLL